VALVPIPTILDPLLNKSSFTSVHHLQNETRVLLAKLTGFSAEEDQTTSVPQIHNIHSAATFDFFQLDYILVKG
jgi:hypothetical protein